MLRVLLAVLLLALGASASQAQGRDEGELPARFTVTGVAAGDTLTVRARPDGDARRIATLQPGATGVEVIRLASEGRWGLVPLREGSGWVRMRFLAREAPSPTPLPRPLFCRGTEPFWALSVPAGGAATLDRPEEGVIRLRRHGEVGGATGGVMAFDMGGQTLDLTVVRRTCSDGMSDRPYGLAAMVWDRGGTFLEGCCTLTSR
jgi:uncharacterized membrane protein